MFSQNFPGYQLYVVCGESLVDRINKDYETALGNAENYLSSHRSESSSRYYEGLKEDCKALQEKIAHLKSRKFQIAGLYSNVGKYKLGRKELKLHDLEFRPVKESYFPSKAQPMELVMAY